MTTYEPVRIVFRGWREEKGIRKIVRKECDGGFPSSNEIGMSSRVGKYPNMPYQDAKKLYSIMLSALLREPSGSEYHFIKPGTKGVRCILPIERDGELPQGCGFILAEGRCVWPTLQTRDQMNYGGIIWKFLGDVLEADGYFEAHDDWLAFQCGNLRRGLNRKVPAYTELMFFPSPDRLTLEDEGDDAGRLL